jgi:hypothetical protein
VSTSSKLAVNIDVLQLVDQQYGRIADTRRAYARALAARKSVAALE